MKKRPIFATTTVIAMSFAVLCCVEPYDPPTRSENLKYLVVEGFANTTSNLLTVNLSYTIPLDSNTAPEYVTFALVEFQNESGLTLPLQNAGRGRYTLEGDYFHPGDECRIRITIGSKQYESEAITLTSTPPIDSITYAIEGDDLEISVNTHDFEEGSRYYRWNYIETWEYTSNYPSSWVIENREVRPRMEHEDIYKCWRSDTLKDIIVGSTAMFSQNVVDHFHLTSIPSGDLKLSRKYSILVQQHTLTQQEYDYWLNLKKITENLGTLFDPMPGELIGNIHSTTNPNEPVMGYFSGGGAVEKRIFIDIGDLPEEFRYRSPFCQLDTILVQNVRAISERDALINTVYQGLWLLGYTTSSQQCIDCRDLGKGVTIKPPFWE